MKSTSPRAAPDTSTETAPPESPLPESLATLADLAPTEQAMLALADLRARWAVGDQIRVEAYLAALPALAGEPEHVVHLALQEFMLASERGAASDIGNLARRFPAHAGRVRELAERWRALADATRSASGSANDLVGYEILGELGRGGMGVVYKARHRRLNRLAALKMIIGGEHVSPAHRLRFLAEAQALARLNHPHIVRVYESGELDGCSYIALEFVEGGNLADRLRSEKLTSAQVAELMEVLAWGVQAAHAVGVIHRDLKPSNILLRSDGTPIITDFGLAKDLAADGGLTNTGTVLGTPAYMAPEQAQGRTDIGPAADVYALGVMMYECLTGSPPFQGTSIELVLAQVMDKPLPPTRLRADIAPALEAVCLKCLEKDPAARYATAGDLATDLRGFLKGDEVRATVVDKETWFAHWAKRAGFDVLGVLGGNDETRVYHARQTRLRREVALKVVATDPAGRQAALEQLERQAIIASDVKRHYYKAGHAPRPLVVEVYDLGERDGLAYCAMEFAPGGSLAALAQRVAPADRPVREAAELTLMAATALATLHALGHVHGNLSPGNILLAGDGSVTFTDLCRGPGRATDDVYGLGAVLYLLLTGRRPDPDRAVVSPGRVRSDLPARLESICLMCLDANPARRYQKVEDVGDALKGFLRETHAPAGGGTAIGHRGIPPGFTHIEPLGDTRLGRLVKALSPDGEDVTIQLIDTARLSSSAVTQFTNALQAAAKVRHPNIRATLAIEEHAGRLTVVQEYLPRGTLTQRLTAGPFSEADAAALITTIADALHYAHEHGLFHGDLDPDKVLFAADGTPRVTDFHLVADVEGASVAQSGVLDVQLETRAGYKSPEYMRREPLKLTPAADVYSLGAMLAELLMGAPPEGVFGTRAGLPDRKWIGLEQAATHSRRAVTKSPALALVCKQAMEWNPNKRHQTAAQFAAHVRGEWAPKTGWFERLFGQ